MLVESRYHDLMAKAAPGCFAAKEFTADWFTRNIVHWIPILQPLRGKPVRVPEIGSYEGRSAVFFLEFLPESTISSIDLFSAPAGALFDADYEARFDRNTAAYGPRVEKIKDRSASALDKLRAVGRRFDVIYIDGSHKRGDVFVDSVLSWQLLDVGGILIWDD